MVQNALRKTTVLDCTSCRRCRQRLILDIWLRPRIKDACASRARGNCVRLHVPNVTIWGRRIVAESSRRRSANYLGSAAMGFLPQGDDESSKKKKHKLAVQVGRLGFLPVSRSIGKTASDAQIIGRSKDKSPRGPDRALKEDHGALLDSDSLAFALACWCELLSIRASHHALKHLWWTFLGPVGEGRPSNHGDATRHTTKGLYNGTISAT